MQPRNHSQRIVADMIPESGIWVLLHCVVVVVSSAHVIVGKVSAAPISHSRHVSCLCLYIKSCFSSCLCNFDLSENVTPRRLLWCCQSVCMHVVAQNDPGDSDQGSGDIKKHTHTNTWIKAHYVYSVYQHLGL